MRVLFVADSYVGGTSRMRLHCMKQAEPETVGFVEAPVPSAVSSFRKTVDRVVFRLGWPRYTQGNALVELASRGSYDVIWVETVQYLAPSLLRRLRRASPRSTIVGLVMDDPCSKKVCGWRKFRWAAPLYDVLYVVRDQSVADLERLGARRVLRYHKGFDPETHRPMDLPDDAERHDIGFVGHWEPKREDDIAFLLRRGLNVGIAGANNWFRGRYWESIRPVYSPAAFGDDYARLLCSARIGLCFYSEWNHDVENSRMYEIPACGTFMLAERNAENVHVFEEGKEAEFFSSQDELLEKVTYYLSHDAERKRIAEAGRARCFRDGYDYRSRLRGLLAGVSNVSEGARGDVRR